MAKIEVLDGYVDINITNQTSYALEVRDISNLEVEGYIKITDIQPDGTVVETEYERPTTRGNYSTTYDVLAGQYYRFVTGQSSILETTDTYIKKTALGIDWLVKDVDPPDETKSILLDKVPLLQGTYFFDPDFTNLNDFVVSAFMVPFAHIMLSKTYDTSIEPPPIILDENGNNIWNDEKGYLVGEDPSDECVAWFIVCVSREYTTILTYQKGQVEYVTHYVDASFDITIEFVGNDQGTVDIVSNNGTVILNGRINNPSGTTTITTNKNVVVKSENAMLGGANVEISAGTGIGEIKGKDIIPLRVEIEPGGSLIATSMKGNVVLSQWNSNMVINSVGTGKGKVNLFTYYDIIGLGTTTHVYGDENFINGKYDRCG